MITKDAFGNADFIFGVDMNRLMIDNSAYSALIADMSDTAKRQVADNSEITSFIISRRQVKKELSLNSLGSAAISSIFTKETISQPVISSMNEMKQTSITVSGQTRDIKYLTASDIGLSKQTAGTYQYELSISVIDGFIPTINKLLKKLYRTNNDITAYLALLDIPDNYDSKRRRMKVSIKKTTIDRMSKSYVDALSYFQNLNSITEEYKRAASLIASRAATKESIETFQKRLNTVTSKVEALISKTGAGVSPSSTANKSANSGFINAPMLKIKQTFNNTVSVEHKDNKFVDYFKGKGRIGGGLNTYSSTEVRNSIPETIYLETPTTSLELLENRGVTFTINPISEVVVGGTSVQETKSIGKYIGSSAVTIGGMLKDDLSPIDLSTVTIGSLVSTADINAAVLTMTPKLTSLSKYQTPTDKITKVIPKEIVKDAIVNVSRTMVLVGAQSSDSDTYSTGLSTSMLKSLEWKYIEEVSNVNGTTLLCKQEDALSDVANGFFLMETK
jgi:hypothetical protein